MFSGLQILYFRTVCKGQGFKFPQGLVGPPLLHSHAPLVEAHTKEMSWVGCTGSEESGNRQEEHTGSWEALKRVFVESHFFKWFELIALKVTLF